MGAWSDFSEIHCSIARAMGEVGDPWKALIVRDLHLGLLRFDELAADLGLSRKVLTERLATMIEDGLVERSPVPGSRRHRYGLTPKGADLVPVLLALLAWGDRWLSGVDGVPAIVVHAGHDTSAAVVCRECGEPMCAADVSGRPGPGARRARGTARVMG